MTNENNPVACAKCGSEPSLVTVFATGEYYKCKPCNFPSFQFPIKQTHGGQVDQWNAMQEEAKG